MRSAWDYRVSSPSDMSSQLLHAGRFFLGSRNTGNPCLREISWLVGETVREAGI